MFSCWNLCVWMSFESKSKSLRKKNLLKKKLHFFSYAFYGVVYVWCEKKLIKIPKWNRGTKKKVITPRIRNIKCKQKNIVWEWLFVCRKNWTKIIANKSQFTRIRRIKTFYCEKKNHSDSFLAIWLAHKQKKTVCSVRLIKIKRRNSICTHTHNQTKTF